MQPNEDKEGSYAFKIEGAALAADVWEECDRTLQFFARIRPYLINYVVLDDYYGDLIKIPNALKEKLGTSPYLLHRMTSIAIELHAMCDKAVNGFLATGQSFRDRAVTKLRAGPKSQHPVWQCIRDLEAQHAVYRLLTQLRNLGLHNEAIFRAIPLKVDADNEAYTIGLQLNKAELLSRLSPSKLKAVGDTSSIPENVDFLESAQLYMECHRTILSKILELQSEDLVFSIGFMSALGSGARGTPPNAIPMIFRGVPDQIRNGTFGRGETVNANVIEFPRQEYLILLKVFPALAGTA